MGRDMHWFSLVILPAVVRSATFVKVGNNPGSSDIQFNGVGAGAFSPDKVSNFHHDSRYPFMTPNPGGTCNGNIYNPSAVSNGPGLWNVYFGGWDGVSECHDSVSVAVTNDSFITMGEHAPMIETGMPDVIHVNNPSATKYPGASGGDEWLMAYTELVAATNLNKPGISTGFTGKGCTTHTHTRTRTYMNHTQ